ncbi:unnamed protein product [Gordionus sp. m RMFG-2023]
MIRFRGFKPRAKPLPPSQLPTSYEKPKTKSQFETDIGEARQGRTAHQPTEAKTENGKRRRRKSSIFNPLRDRSLKAKGALKDDISGDSNIYLNPMFDAKSQQLYPHHMITPSTPLKPNLFDIARMAE